MPLRGGALDVTLPAVDCTNTRPHDAHDYVNEYGNAFHCIGADQEVTR